MTQKAECLTIAVGGKIVCSSNRIEKIESPLHIISAQISELRLTLAQKSTDDKSNEIPVVQQLLKGLNIKSHIVVADALKCQKETAEIIVEGEADYLLCVKDNHPNLKKDIEDYVQDKSLQKSMESISKTEMGHGRIEKRTAFVTDQTDWLPQKSDWKGLICVVRYKRYLRVNMEVRVNGIIIYQTAD